MMRALRTEELPRPNARFINPVPVIEPGKRAPKAQKKNAPMGVYTQALKRQSLGGLVISQSATRRPNMRHLPRMLAID